MARPEDWKDRDDIVPRNKKRGSLRGRKGTVRSTEPNFAVTWGKYTCMVCEKNAMVRKSHNLAVAICG